MNGIVYHGTALNTTIILRIKRKTVHRKVHCLEEILQTPKTFNKSANFYVQARYLPRLNTYHSANKIHIKVGGDQLFFNKNSVFC